MGRVDPNTPVLAVDVGSSSVRALVLNREGQALYSVQPQVMYAAETTPDGGSMIDSAAMLAMIEAVIDEACTAVRAHDATIGLVAVDTLVGNVMGVDAHGQPCTPIFTWADKRGASEAMTLRGQLDAAAYNQRTGCRVHPSYWPVRLRWLERAMPDAYGRAVWWMSLGEYATWRWSGERRVSLSMASWSGLLNRHTLDWDAESLAVLGVRREQLSQLSSEPISGLREPYDRRWPALADVPWTLPIGDGVGSNIGAGCTDPAHVAISVGTSGAMRVIVPGTPETSPDGLFVYRVDAERSLVGGALSNVGNLYAWMMRTLHVGDSEAFSAAVAALPPDSHGLTLLPFLTSERAPGWNDQIPAAFTGMTFDTEPVHLVRAGLEAVAYRFAQIARRLKPLISADAVYIASGAPVTRSPVLAQILADVLGAPVYLALEMETTIRGTVFFALGEAPAPVLGREVLPDMAAHTVYQAGMARQEGLYKVLSENS